MAQFYELEVIDIYKTIREAVVVTLRPSKCEVDKFNFIQGQYLTFRQNLVGHELRRSYSICAGRDDGILQVAIKRVDGGAFSTWVNEELKIGDTLQAMPPMGNFYTTLNASNEKNYLGFAGGSGITPLLSVVKTTLAQEPNATFTLVYANKAVNSIMFREELDDLKNIHMGRLNVIHVLETDTQEIDLFTGLITKDKCAQLFESGWINPSVVDTAFICGPEPMMLGIVSALRAVGLDDAHIKFELFASSQPGRIERLVQSKDTSSDTNQTTAAITLDGATQTIRMLRNVSVLDAALQNDIDAPFACKAGVCSTCRCRIREGEVEMVANHALEDYEVEQGYVLSCQSYAVTDTVVIDYDQ
ncbi:2Fe-2S iron-sulfur cluster-binding protein [Pseudopelagicola sp. nBUS_19]|uniref:2Fe-2S iron-sulfur cluster-binding protein n=1 Tax=Pseudopelagicola sp. nBUS_19 TaxID=3395316 RepID=UPI003EBB8BB6